MEIEFIQKQLADQQKLLEEYTEKIDLEDDPKKRKQYENKIEEIDNRINEYKNKLKSHTITSNRVIDAKEQNLKSKDEIKSNIEFFFKEIKENYEEIDNIEKNIVLNENQLCQYLLPQIKIDIKNFDPLHENIYNKDTRIFESIVDRLLELTENDEEVFIRLSLVLVSLYRRYGNLKKAVLKLKAVDEKLDPYHSHLKLKSSLEYENAFIYSLKHDPVNARESFKKSIEYSEQNNDIIKAIGTKSTLLNWEYLFDDENKSFENYVKELKEILVTFGKLMIEKNYNRNEIIKSQRNIYMYLFDILYYSNSKDYSKQAIEYARLYLSNKKSKEKPNEQAEKYLMARIDLLNGNYSQPISYFEKTLPKNKTELKEKEKALIDDRDYARFFINIGAKYLDYGKALLETGNKKKSINVLKLGLKTRKDYGNTPFHKKINVLLKEIN